MIIIISEMMADLFSVNQNCPNCLDKNNSQLLQDNSRLKVRQICRGCIFF